MGWENRGVHRRSHFADFHIREASADLDSRSRGNGGELRPAVDASRAGWHSVRMSPTTAVVRMRVPARRLRRAEKILSKLGLTPADALNMLLAQIEIREGLPFEVSTGKRPLLSADEQAAAWTEALGAY